MPLAGRPLVEWSLAAFRAAPSVGAIVVACPPGNAHGLNGDDLTFVDGGTTRAESVRNALEAVNTDLVAIHDAARPLLTPELIEGVIATLEADPEAAGAIAAARVTDTIKRAEGTLRTFYMPDMQNVRQIELTMDRERLWAAQTPQVFRVAALREALAADPERIAGVTDEAMIVEAVGGKVLIHPAPAENLKVTTPLDLRLAELLLAERGDG